jgi:glycosyltransferase involved in cell wall biosynthesis
MPKDCSIIIPCFKTSFKLLNKCIEDIIKHWDRSKINLEIILIVDGGIKKNSEEFNEFLKIKKKNELVKLLHNKLHIGQQKSVLNGFDYSNSDVVITIDDDYKYPVENLSKLVDKIYTEELDCIIGKPKILNESIIRRFGTWLVKKIFNNVYQKIYFTSFRILKKDISKAIIKKNYLVPVVGYLILEETGQVENFDYEKNTNSNTSRYNYFSLMSYFFNMNLFYTNYLYKMFLYAGFIITIVSIILLTNYLYLYFFKNTQPGFTSLVILILGLIQIVLYSAGLILKYIVSISSMIKETSIKKITNYREIK